MTQWCGEAWSQIDHDSVVRGLKKLGITTALDWSEETFSQHSYMQNEFTVDSEGESDTSLDSDTETN